jgi:hypothetical protein
MSCHNPPCSKAPHTRNYQASVRRVNFWPNSRRCARSGANTSSARLSSFLGAPGSSAPLPQPSPSLFGILGGLGLVTAGAEPLEGARELPAQGQGDDVVSVGSRCSAPLACAVGPGPSLGPQSLPGGCGVRVEGVGVPLAPGLRPVGRTVATASDAGLPATRLQARLQAHGRTLHLGCWANR